MSDRAGYKKMSANIGQQEFMRNIEMWLERQTTSIFMGLFFYAIALIFLYTFFNGYPGKFLFVLKFLAIGITSNFLPDFTISMYGANDSLINWYRAGVDNGLWKIVVSYGLKMIYAIPAFVIGYIAAEKIFGKIAKEKEVLKHIDGTEMRTEEEVLSIIKQRNIEEPDRGHVLSIPIGKIGLTRANETYGTLILGASGSGKTVAISNMLDALQKKDDYKIIAYTPKGDFISKYYNEDRGDIIINPFDFRGINLNVFDLVKSRLDFQRIAAVLIPEPAGSQDPFWPYAARAVFSAIMNYCVVTGKTTNKELWEVICYPKERMISEVATTYGSEEIAKYYSETKIAASLEGVMLAYTGIFKYLAQGEEEKFDMKQWLTDPNQKGWIFISNHEELSSLLKPYLTLFIDFIVAAHLSLPDNRDRRIVYVLDELSTLHKSIGKTVHKLAITGRSKGAVTIVGAQGKTMLEDTLSKEQAADVYNTIGNSIFLRVGSDDITAKWMSDVIGETSFYETEITGSYKVGESADGVTARETRRTEKLILPSTFNNSMPSLTGIVRLVEYGGVCKTKFPTKNRPDIAEGFIDRPDLSLDGMLEALAQLDKAQAICSIDHKQLINNNNTGETENEISAALF